MKLPDQRDYPKELHIGDQTFDIVFCRRFPIPGKDLMGLCCVDTQKIYIKKGLSKRQTFMTFLHEVAHAICDMHEIKISHKDIYILEEALTVFFLSNF